MPVARRHVLGSSKRAKVPLFSLALRLVGVKPLRSIRGRYQSKQIFDSSCRLLHQMDIGRRISQNYCPKCLVLLQKKHPCSVRRAASDRHRQWNPVHRPSLLGIRFQFGHHLTLNLSQTPLDERPGRVHEQGDTQGSQTKVRRNQEKMGRRSTQHTIGILNNSALVNRGDSIMTK